MESGDLEYAAVSGNRFTPERLKGMTESPGKNARERCQEPQSAGRANGSDPDSQRNAGQGKEDNSQEQYCTQGDVREAGVLSTLSILLWIMHRDNIVRLWNGTEGKIGAPN